LTTALLACCCPLQLSLKNDTFGVSPCVQLEHGQADLEETLAELPLALVEVTRKLVEEGASKANSPSASMTAGHRRGQSISLQVGAALYTVGDWPARSLVLHGPAIAAMLLSHTSRSQA
jgi:hypothetical protein